MLFTGEYEHSIDAKQRMAIPAEIRGRLEPSIHGDGFYLAPGANGHLWLWPQRTFEQMAAALEHTLIPGEEMQEFEELMFSQARRLEIDKAGRIRLPEATLRRYGLNDSVVILGIKDHLELRDPEQWKQRREQSMERQTEILLRARQAYSESRRRDNNAT